MKQFQFGLMLAALAFVGNSQAFGQQILDRVLDRVGKELDKGLKPIQVDEQPADRGQPNIANPNGAEPGYLGVVADDRQDQGRGVRVLEVVASGPADRGGLMKDDLITAINGQPVQQMDEMGRILSGMPVGAKVKFTVTRNDADKTVVVTLGQRPAPGERKFQKFGRQPDDLPNPVAEPAAVPAGRPKLGVRTLPVSDEAQRQFNLPNRDGALVVAVTRGAAAERAGIPLGAVITSVDGQPVKNPDGLADLVVRGGARGQLAITYIADGQQVRTTVPLGGAPTSRLVQPPGPSDAAEETVAKPVVPADDETRIEAIERHMQQLEDRLERIEQLLEKKAAK